MFLPDCQHVVVPHFCLQHHLPFFLLLLLLLLFLFFLNLILSPFSLLTGVYKFHVSLPAIVLHLSLSTGALPSFFFPSPIIHFSPCHQIIFPLSLILPFASFFVCLSHPFSLVITLQFSCMVSSTLPPFIFISQLVPLPP